MAYGNYGGRAYECGRLRDDHADADASDGNRYHVVLGDGPVQVALHKQTYVIILRNGVAVPLDSCIVNRIGADDGDEIDPDAWRKADAVATFAVDGHRIDVLWTHEDNYFVYARLARPDGAVWTGWSGYGVGAGLSEPEDPCEAERREVLERFLDVPLDLDGARSAAS